MRGWEWRMGRGGCRRTMDEQEKCWSFLLPPHFCPYVLMGDLLPPPSCSKAPLVPTLHLPPPPPPPPRPSILHLLPLASSACLPSLPPGGPGQCWRHSRDLQEICLSEKQLVSLSTANVCMLRPPSNLPVGSARTGSGLGLLNIPVSPFPFIIVQT